MKKLILALLLTGTLTATAGGPRAHFHRGYHGWHSGPSVSFYWGAAPYSYYGPAYSYAYPAYPSYGYYDYSYARPNYAVSGTLLGALAGGLIGDSIHHQGWEGAGIGAAAGLVLGSVAERNARVQQRTAYSAPPVYYAPSDYATPAQTINDAPTVADAPRVSSAPVSRPVSSMSSANSLFGR